MIITSRPDYKSCNYHGISLQFIQPFSIDNADFPCRDPTIPSPRSFHRVKIFSVPILYEKGPLEFLDEIWKFWLWLAAENWSIILSKGSAWGILAICDPSFGRARGEGSKVKWPASTYVGAFPFPWALLHNDPKLRITFGNCLRKPRIVLQSKLKNYVQVLGH